MGFRLSSSFQILVMCLLLGRISLTDAWGKEGHFMVCKIAEKYLSEEALAAVLDLLPASAGGELASVCSWADDVRFRYRWSSPLHYVDTPDGLCNYHYSRDCHNSAGEKDMCVAGAINNYTAQLQEYRNSQKSEYNLNESLMFLVHFVGDIHQPLHVSFTEDEGGNTIIVHWYNRKTNLHHVWDTDIIETAMKDFYGNDLNLMIEAIDNNITVEMMFIYDKHPLHCPLAKIPSWESCSGESFTCADRYASEGIYLSCNYAYKDVEQNATLRDDYFLSRLPVVETRIAQGGVRLAALLNRIFENGVNETNYMVSAA